MTTFITRTIEIAVATHIRLLLIILLSINYYCDAFAQSSFLAEQRQYARVRTALSEKEQTVRDELARHGISADSAHVLLVAYKAEKQLEVYAKNKTASTYTLITTYDICAVSGTLGPKSSEGDGQTPEGFYHINRFNPTSSFYLSLGVDYPNQSDRRRSNAQRLGGDIFIHGACVTIGCLPMTDDKIKEIYLYALFARNNGQSRPPVYIFPFRMTDANCDAYYSQYPDIQNFWRNLKTLYDKFAADKKALNVAVDRNGNYGFNGTN